MIPRCPHDIYSPDGDGRPSEYCSGCYPNFPLYTSLTGFLPCFEELEPEHEDGDDDAECPACFAPMKIEDEYDLECIACGFNDL